jgi:hypothetical protein
MGMAGFFRLAILFEVANFHRPRYGEEKWHLVYKHDVAGKGDVSISFPDFIIDIEDFSFHTRSHTLILNGSGIWNEDFF